MANFMTASISIGRARATISFGLRCSFSGISVHPLGITRHYPVILGRGFQSGRYLQVSNNTELKDDWREIIERRDNNITNLSREHYYKHYKIPDKSSEFFGLGKMFNMLWTEPYIGKDPPPSENSRYTRIMFNEFAYHTLRSFVVVEERPNQNFCYCWPLYTYGGRAGTKTATLQSVHAIAYSGQRPPQKLAGEIHMKRDPIRFVMRTNLDVGSKVRINMGVEYPIKFGSKVNYEGNVHGGSMPKLLEYRNEIRNRENVKNLKEWGPLGPASYNPVTKTYK